MKLDDEEQAPKLFKNDVVKLSEVARHMDFAAFPIKDTSTDDELPQTRDISPFPRPGLHGQPTKDAQMRGLQAVLMPGG